MDWSTILCACIAAGGSLIGVIISNNRSNAKIQGKMETNQAVMDSELKELTREVRQHNNFAQRMPVVEEQIKVINHRINDIEKKVN